MGSVISSYTRWLAIDFMRLSIGWCCSSPLCTPFACHRLVFNLEQCSWYSPIAIESRATHQKLSSNLLFMPKRNRMTRERFYKRSNQPTSQAFIIQFIHTFLCTLYHTCACVRACLCVNVHIRLCKSWIFHIQILSYAMCMIDVIHIYLTWWCCSLLFRSISPPIFSTLGSLCQSFIHFHVRFSYTSIFRFVCVCASTFFAMFFLGLSVTLINCLLWCSLETFAVRIN